MGIEAALIGGGAALLGSAMSGNAAKSAANTSANAQIAASQIAADAAKFRPVGVTTSFGKSNFGFNPEGYLESAGYTLDPRLQALQSGLLGNYGGQLAAAQGLDTSALTQGSQALMNLGNQYLATSPEQAATDYYNQQRGLLAGGREQQLANLRNKTFQTGRAGLATGGTSTGMMATNPEMAAYYNAVAQQDADLAARADQYGMQRTQFGTQALTGGAGLLGTGYGLQTQAYSPLMTTLGLGSTIEQLGQSPLDIGAQLGGRTATAGANVGQSLLYGGLSAAKTQQAANAYSPFGSALSGVGNTISGLNYSAPKTGQTTGWFGQTINDPTYGAGTAYSNMTPWETSNMMEYGL
jgi:hypothetical protein